MNIFNYKNILLSLSFLILAIIPINSSPALSHEGEVHTIVDTSEEQKQKIQKCIASPEFQDSCYMEICGEEGTYLCAEDILDAVVDLADPQTAMDVLNGIMQSTLFDIQTDGHLLAHIIGNAIAHHYGFTGESMLLCPHGFNWGCTHGFFEGALEVKNDPVNVAEEICGSLPERPFSRGQLCYHGVGHMFMFHTSYDMTHALSLCDEIPSSSGRERCYDGALMEKNETPDFYELKEKLGFRDDDVLAPCSNLEYRYRKACYVNHGKYFCAHAQLSMQEASHACLNAGDHTRDCMTGLSIMVTRPTWQPCLIELSSPEPYNPETLLENAVYLCSVIPSEYIEHCQWIAIASLVSYDHIQEAMDFCSLHWVREKSICFHHIGTLFSGSSTNESEAIQKCNVMPEEYMDVCIQGAQIDYAQTIQQAYENEYNQISHSDQIQEQGNETNKVIQGEITKHELLSKKESSILLYLFITLSCILLIAPLIYHNRALLKKMMKV